MASQLGGNWERGTVMSYGKLNKMGHNGFGWVCFDDGADDVAFLHHRILDACSIDECFCREGLQVEFKAVWSESFENWEVAAIRVIGAPSDIGDDIEGHIKAYDPEKGYGFIRCTGKRDLFFHISRVRGSNSQDMLVPGVKVKGEIGIGPEGRTCAHWVEV
jgi:cold shock CspA family protein